MVPRAGLEPARSCLRGILNPLCLPIPPPGFLYNSPSMYIINDWRLKPESNRRTRLCRPLHNHSAIQPDNSNGDFTLSLLKLNSFLEAKSKFVFLTHYRITIKQMKRPRNSKVFIIPYDTVLGILMI